MVSNRTKIALGIFAILLSSIWAIQAQPGRSKLLKKERLKRQITKTEDMLAQTEAEQNNAQIVLKGVRALVYNHSHLITQLDNELRLLDDSIADISEEIDQTEKELLAMKNHFSDILYVALKNKHRHSAMNSLLSSKKFREAYQKARMMKEMTRYRKAQLRVLKDKQRANLALFKDFTRKKNERKELLGSKEQEVQRLEYAIEKEQKMLEKLAGKKKEIEGDLKQKLLQLQDLEDLIRVEIAKGGSQSDSNWTRYEQKLYPDLSPYFEKNKGKLPWPAEDYIVSGRFGSAPHPDFKHVTVQNNGIDLLIHPGSSVHSVFDGKVMRVLELPGMGTTLLIKHDQFYTVYANLESIFVKQNDEVSTGERLGKVAHGQDLKEFHFEIWEGSKKRNPEYWLGI